jgi:hypothetical protein
MAAGFFVCLPDSNPHIPLEFSTSFFFTVVSTYRHGMYILQFPYYGNQLTFAAARQSNMATAAMQSMWQ